MAPRFRVGLRVDDVMAAETFYAGFGFEPIGSISDPAGRPLLSILERAGVHLLVDAVEGLPFPDTERERLTRVGPRGLGVALGLGVDDLDAALAYCRRAGCTITCGPMDEAWGERVFECVDPFGYQWELSQPIAGAPVADPFGVVAASWFGREPS